MRVMAKPGWGGAGWVGGWVGEGRGGDGRVVEADRRAERLCPPKLAACPCRVGGGGRGGWAEAAGLAGHLLCERTPQRSSSGPIPRESGRSGPTVVSGNAGEAAARWRSGSAGDEWADCSQRARGPAGTGRLTDRAGRYKTAYGPGRSARRLTGAGPGRYGTDLKTIFVERKTHLDSWTGNVSVKVGGGKGGVGQGEGMRP